MTSDPLSLIVGVDHPREIARRLSRSVVLRQEIAALASILIEAAHANLSRAA